MTLGVITSTSPGGHEWSSRCAALSVMYDKSCYHNNMTVLPCFDTRMHRQASLGCSQCPFLGLAPSRQVRRRAEIGCKGHSVGARACSIIKLPYQGEVMLGSFFDGYGDPWSGLEQAEV